MLIIHSPKAQDIRLQKKLHTLARSLRYKSTMAEEVLWRYLRRKQICGVKFRRQQPLYQYIVDFYSRECKLVIEVDGPIHDNQKDRDYSKDIMLKKYGLTVVRFSNDLVMNDINNVINIITKYVTNFPSPA